MGLREYLAQWADIAKGSKELFASSEEMRKKAAEEAFVKQAPELIRQGKLEDVAAMGVAAGDKNPMNTLFEYKFKTELEKQKPSSEKPFTEQQLIAQGISPDQAKLFAAMPSKQQAEAITNIGKAKQFNLQMTEEQRRVGQLEYAKKKDLNSLVNPVEKDLIADKTALDKVDAAFKARSIPGDAIVMNFIARKMADEKGPLSESDISRLAGKTFTGDVNGAMNWVKSAVDPKAPPAQREAYRQLVQLARDNYETNKDARITAAINQAYEANPALFDGGKPDNVLVQKIKRLGYKDARINSDGNLEIVKGVKAAPAQVLKPEGGIDINAAISQAKLIKDPEIRDQIIKAIEKNLENAKKTGKPIKPESFQTYWTNKVAPFLPKD